MDSNSVGGAFRRRSRAEADRLVQEFKQSGLGRREFCAARGLSMHTLDAWRRRMAQSTCDEKIVPVEIVANRNVVKSSMAADVTRSGPFRVVLARGISIEVEPGFDAAELRRLITALDSAAVYGVVTRSA